MGREKVKAAAGKILKEIIFDGCSEIIDILVPELYRNTYYSYTGGNGKKERLVAVAMYAPQWLDMVEEVLGMEGFESGCYYFMARMNERFDDRKKAVIARYTPLSTEELNNGCFDMNCFFEVYEKLGEKNFALLYKAAKYIADVSP